MRNPRPFDKKLPFYQIRVQNTSFALYCIHNLLYVKDVNIGMIIALEK